MKTNHICENEKCRIYADKLQDGLCPICFDEKNGQATALIAMRRNWKAVWGDQNIKNAMGAFDRPFWSASLLSDAKHNYGCAGLPQWIRACEIAQNERQQAQVEAGVLDPMFL